jgi:adenylyltransferase/sulfurtransferase
VVSLEYEAFGEMALIEGNRIVEEATRRFPINDAACEHRLGHLGIGEVAIRVEVLGGHRKEAFEACSWIVDEVKARVPIWKKEHYLDGTSEWLAAETAAPISEDRLYARQTRLTEVGEVGQQKLKAARVLVVGAGGLGCAALPYLAAAGVGRIGICDDDVVEAENLHRQVLFGAGDLGRRKAEVAAGRCSAQNPFVEAVPIIERLTGSNASRIVSDYDLVLDCTDNLATKFDLNRACVSLGKPLIVAGIYRFEGQIQIVLPGGPCLECLWQKRPSDGCVGTCAEVGVLGAVPGVLGSMQAMVALKQILSLLGEMDGTRLTLVDLMDLRTTQVTIPRREDCPVCGNGSAEQPLELVPDELSRFRVIDIRERDELIEDPSPWPDSEWLPLSAWEGFTPGDRPVLLVCRSGTRTYRLASALREEGMRDVYSLPGGMRTLRKLLDPPQRT